MSDQPETLSPGPSGGARSCRDERPAFVDLLPPCNSACPAGENIQRWLRHVQSGDYEKAWRVLTEDNPLPATMGRICYHPCETKCNRAEFDSAVGVNAVERFVGDEALKHGWQFAKPVKETGKRVLVVGAGPSGLSAAYHLRKAGHTVAIHDAGPSAGGMMRFGIPRYRLPRDVLDAEIQRILDLGVELKLDAKVDDLQAAMAAGRFDAAFLGVGAQAARRAEIPAVAAATIVDAVSLLRSVEGGEKPLLGRRVAVYGGGNTALDTARTARRLGAAEPVIVYRRIRAKMPAHDFEVEEALEEGVTVKWLSTIKRVNDRDITIERMELDANGFPQPTGSFEILAADCVALALGQEVEIDLIELIPAIAIAGGVVEVDPNMMTGAEGIFAGGDMVPGERTATVAIGHGKKAAQNIDAWLRQKDQHREPRHAAATSINTWYYSKTPRAERPKLALARRQTTFDEVVLGLGDVSARNEARRCLSCGNCFACDSCIDVCPENAVSRVGERYEIDTQRCTSCKLCVKECPCGAITMVPNMAAIIPTRATDTAPDRSLGCPAPQAR